MVSYKKSPEPVVTVTEALGVVVPPVLPVPELSVVDEPEESPVPVLEPEEVVFPVLDPVEVFPVLDPEVEPVEDPEPESVTEPEVLEFEPEVPESPVEVDPEVEPVLPVEPEELLVDPVEESVPLEFDPVF